jgi:2'-5' RNA ligase
MARVFVAVDVGDTVRREASRVIAVLTGKLEAVKKPPKVTWVKPTAMHVTIRFLGEVDDADVDHLCALMAPPMAIAPFEILWRGIGTFPHPKHPRALWLGVISGGPGLAQVEAEVTRRFAGTGTVELEDRALLPHLTLGRIKMAGEGVDWPKVLQAAELRNVTSKVTRVTLYRSQLSQWGPNYTELVSASLIGP